ncbi:hypothetical protein PUNSTDRAFT_54761 [Punctularia strigosozonata HHB-11173 SS5]|uniref:uncharacterized protein n=1 Tax=Punctularia strigosozonata (strain HHB-11173) TaxID=741275 RepID=UPI000441773B|nr:uncharacterized protein PUNSTDRAFT_54761 [Punctularia strigosozonata HHB-11173 SS5]EIN05933.1 hypothetical protein PUNSTDRAFT_54761 [Punctularia strigosozonata HHB-11173 SS5]
MGSRLPSPSPSDARLGVKAEPSNGDDDLPVDDVKPKPEGEPLPVKTNRDSSTPGASSSRRQQQPQARPGPQLIGDLPVATEAAMATFEELKANHYQYGTLGRSREALEGMTCDCQYDHAEDEPWMACGEGSDCINRLTQVECLPGECRCGAHCRNQRFNRREYAPIEIVQTEKKGFGLRAREDIRKDQFIYEYVGDVVSHPSFKKRMREYAQEGIRHFYFMMLQKDEYIDATKRGGIGRFANHSCSPNCYVAKWTVGTHVRMGIFASRHIRQHEELTFNYNVDRYGHDAQPCYCGEPNCVGFLGGKTQTDIGAMDDLYLDALGITDEVEKLQLKGTKKKKGRKLDEDYIPDLKPLQEKDVPKVIQALRQTSSRKVLYKLITRIKLTDDQAALRQVMRLRGFSQMTNILLDYEDDEDITTVALECMYTWPLLKRNKVEASGISVPVQKWADSDNEKLKGLAQRLLDKWAELQTAYRIAKRVKADGTEEVERVLFEEPDRRPRKRIRFTPHEDVPVLDIVPLGTRAVTPDYSSRSSDRFKPLTEEERLLQEQRARECWFESNRKTHVTNIIAAARAAQEAAREEEARKAAESAKKEEERARRREKALANPKKALTPEEKEALKEKRLQKLVGAIVVKCMSKYQKQMDHDLFKKHAKELTQIIADKEKKSSSYKEGKLDSLSDEKTAKIKKFAKEYVAKVIRKLEKSGQAKRRSSQGKDQKQLPTPATTSTPDSPGANAAAEPDISLSAVFDDDAMDVDGHGAEEDGLDGDHDVAAEEGKGSPNTSPRHASPNGLHDESSGQEPPHNLEFGPAVVS